MKTMIVILGDQLSESIASLRSINKNNDTVLMCEVKEEAKYVLHHKKKITLIFSAMRHFADHLAKDYNLIYRQYDDPQNQGSIVSEIKYFLKTCQFDRVVITEPNEYRLLDQIKKLKQYSKTPIEILENNLFLSSKEFFNIWAKGKKQHRMEFFYREMRKKYHILMEDNQPIGGKWNFDALNRKPPKSGLNPPKPLSVKPDKITKKVIKLVQDHFSDHFGQLEPFTWGITRAQAKKTLAHFINQRLPTFGDYQDAMIEGEPFMFHSLISGYLNCGLLLPLECIKAAEQAFHQKKAPLNAVEGFIRQILGWREFVRGIYWLHMPSYKEKNFFNAKRALPNFYWNGETQMNCLKQCIQDTQTHAYAHHIQRLMVLGNFALLTGVDPNEINYWFLVVYLDAYEWVELPNVTGMAIFADGGMLASKPYAAGGSYINKMSNYCKQCHYKVSLKNGPSACPFNYLYWDFLSRNRDLLAKNPRIGMMYRTLDKMSDEKKRAIKKDTVNFLNLIDKKKDQNNNDKKN